MSIHTHGEQVYRFNQVFFQKKAKKNYQETINQLKKIIRSFFIFNAGFFIVFILQIIFILAQAGIGKWINMVYNLAILAGLSI